MKKKFEPKPVRSGKADERRVERRRSEAVADPCPADENRGGDEGRSGNILNDSSRMLRVDESQDEEHGAHRKVSRTDEDDPVAYQKNK